MTRISIVVLGMWLVGFASSGIAQTETVSNVGGECSTNDCVTENETYFGSWSAKWDLTKQHADLIAQRNDAWPKPFQCYDRQSYHSIFAVMTQRGWQCECTLTPDHFDPQSHQLNRAGRAKIAGIMTNLPEIARQIHVYQDPNSEITDARLSNVREEVATSFNMLPEPQIAATTYMPHGMNGALVEDVQKRFVEGLPDPKVPAASTSTITD